MGAVGCPSVSQRARGNGGSRRDPGGRVVIELSNDVDYVYLLLIAAVGAVGGLGGELLLQRADNTGAVELPGRLKGTRLWILVFLRA